MIRRLAIPIEVPDGTPADSCHRCPMRGLSIDDEVGCFVWGQPLKPHLGGPSYLRLPECIAAELPAEPPAHAHYEPEPDL